MTPFKFTDAHPILKMYQPAISTEDIDLEDELECSMEMTFHIDENGVLTPQFLKK